MCDIQTSQPTCSTNFGGQQWQGQAEGCDNVDNDCNGETDEEFPGYGARCDSDDDVDDCLTGSIGCVAGNVECVGDIACAMNTSCYDPGAPKKQVCMCFASGTSCNVLQGDACDASGDPAGCKCAGGLPCFGGEVCVPGQGCEEPPDK